MQLHTLQSAHKRIRAVRVGRGGKRGKTSGRGGKGQTARAGNKRRPEWRDIIKRIPKRRGYGKHRAQSVVPTRAKAQAITLAAIAGRFENGDTVSPLTLSDKGLLNKKQGRSPAVKIVGNEVGKKLNFEKCAFTTGAKAAVLKAGGNVA